MKARKSYSLGQHIHRIFHSYQYLHYGLSWEYIEKASQKFLSPILITSTQPTVNFTMSNDHTVMEDSTNCPVSSLREIQDASYVETTQLGAEPEPSQVGEEDTAVHDVRDDTPNENGWGEVPVGTGVDEEWNYRYGFYEQRNSTTKTNMAYHHVS